MNKDDMISLQNMLGSFIKEMNDNNPDFVNKSMSLRLNCGFIMNMRVDRDKL